jgi:hypothetical protein
MISSDCEIISDDMTWARLRVEQPRYLSELDYLVSGPCGAGSAIGINCTASHITVENARVVHIANFDCQCRSWVRTGVESCPGRVCLNDEESSD